MTSIFLTAAWRKLALANYEIDPALLTSYVPAGTSLDLWQGRCYVSLVGFMFLDTRLKGIPIPGHRNFEEVNLRFYVVRKTGSEIRRGVVFIKEIVPRHALAWVARALYGEPYQALPMRHTWQEANNGQHVQYAWKSSGAWHALSVEASTAAHALVPGSEAEFITEHYWGYTRRSQARTSEYQVEHPSWNVHPVHRYDVDVDFGAVYGDHFAFLNQQQPVSVMLAEGSAVQVRSGTSLR